MKKLRNIGSRWLPCAAVLVFLLVWEGWVRIADVKEYILPSPMNIFISLVTNLHHMWIHIQVTSLTALTGFVLAMVMSLILVVIMERIHVFRQTLYPFIVISQTIPIIFISPLLFIWFGTGILPKILVVALVCFFPMIMNLLDGLDKVDEEILGLFRSMGAGRWKTFCLVKLPGAMPAFFSGLKVAATYSIMGGVIAEWLGAQHGMGVYMLRAYKTFSTARVFAAIFVVVLMSLTVFKLVIYSEYFLMPWNRNEK